MSNTASEVACPVLLSQRIATGLVKVVLSRGLSLQPVLHLHDLATEVPGKQSKKKTPPFEPRVPQGHQKA